ncbi:DUF3987 domain-containing protein [Patulibacter sp. SYSU D01012]|uniref:DUF3987 domain-containing protein n=1 Tax=Patulibacter sp. SYSU D01012 TaxID=2817381 RepID=UPI001B3094E2|nr:DUF3987 domain-containing protein [Patulibacter sp. SYSU D01012]
MTAATAPLPDVVFQTVLGGIAQDLTAHTEADPAVVLLHLMAGVGAAVGPHAHSDWSSHHTPARLFVLAVGGTGSGKGASERIASRLLRQALPAWSDEGIVGGLVSGEGLLAALGGEPRDPDEDGPPLPVTGRSLLAIEPEFGRVMASSRRDGATLSHLVRELWDSDQAASMSRQRPLRVKGANLSLVGHITPTELQRVADSNAIENGFLNRFLPIMVRRGPLQPFGPPRSLLARDRRNEAAAEVAAAVEHGHSVGCVELDPVARGLWAELYYRLAPERPFLAGALQARGIAHVQRLALVLALGDRDDHVRHIHLNAAFAIWTRAAATWAELYGERTGDPLAERLLAALRDAKGRGTGVLTRTEIREVVGSNSVPAARIKDALEKLRAAGLADSVEFRPGGGGRPAEVWAAVDDSDEDAATLRSLSSQSSHPSHSGDDGRAAA